jgi:hypothetical protein
MIPHFRWGLLRNWHSSHTYFRLYKRIRCANAEQFASNISVYTPLRKPQACGCYSIYYFERFAANSLLFHCPTVGMRGIQIDFAIGRCLASVWGCIGPVRNCLIFRFVPGGPVAIATSRHWWRVVRVLYACGRWWTCRVSNRHLTLCYRTGGLANSMEQGPWGTGSRTFDQSSPFYGIRSSREPETRLCFEPSQFSPLFRALFYGPGSLPWRFCYQNLMCISSLKPITVAALS